MSRFKSIAIYILNVAALGSALTVAAIWVLVIGALLGAI